MATRAVQVFQSTYESKRSEYERALESAHEMLAPVSRFVAEMQDVLASETNVRCSLKFEIETPTQQGIPILVTLSANGDHEFLRWIVKNGVVCSPRGNDPIAVEDLVHSIAILSAEWLAPINAGRR